MELGDGSYHDIYIPDVESSHQVSLKLAGDNYVAMYLQTRLNSRNQRVLHLYSELHLIVNIPNVFDLTIVTNIYGNLFAVKKRVENNLNDRMHPEPVLKDRFVFNTYDYLLTRNEKYLRIKTHNTESNEIILYESDSSQDLILKDNEGSIVTVFAVSYETSLTRLDCRMEIDKAETL